ncbi:MAG TPA: guanylate kinase, partial [Chlamydiales bacterium]|nr:guanylate kinase [Chlamydiales bacterium]
SYTTRPPRENEENGRDYFFVSKEEFEKKIEQNDFIEYAKVFDHYYGTSKSFLDKMIHSGKHVILDIDTQGAMHIKNQIACVLIFILPPSIGILSKRLHNRNTEDEKTIEKRLSWAEKEIALATKYDYQFVNDELVQAYQIFKAILIAEEHKNH